MEDKDQNAAAIEAGIEQARSQLQQGAFARAGQIVQPLLAANPHNVDLLYLLAVAQRYVGRAVAARQTLERLLEIEP